MPHFFLGRWAGLQHRAAKGTHPGPTGEAGSCPRSPVWRGAASPATLLSVPAQIPARVQQGPLPVTGINLLVLFDLDYKAKCICLYCYASTC